MTPYLSFAVWNIWSGTLQDLATGVQLSTDRFQAAILNSFETEKTRYISSSTIWLRYGSESLIVNVNATIYNRSTMNTPMVHPASPHRSHWIQYKLVVWQ
jgi:hypothetical protein